MDSVWRVFISEFHYRSIKMNLSWCLVFLNIVLLPHDSLQAVGLFYFFLKCFHIHFELWTVWQTFSVSTISILHYFCRRTRILNSWSRLTASRRMQLTQWRCRICVRFIRTTRFSWTGRLRFWKWCRWTSRWKWRSCDVTLT